MMLSTGVARRQASAMRRPAARVRSEDGWGSPSMNVCRPRPSGAGLPFGLDRALS
jgi:hypothetical protein